MTIVNENQSTTRTNTVTVTNTQSQSVPQISQPIYIIPQPQLNTNNDEKCLVSDSNGICKQCIFRYALNQITNKCVQVSDLCRTWN
jgi:hypothetical protein